MSFDTYLNPKKHLHKPRSKVNKRHYWLNKEGKLAIVYNWMCEGKWKILLSPDAGRRAFKYTREQYDSFDDALRVYDMLCSTKGLTEAAA